MPGLNAALGAFSPDLPLVAAGFGLRTMFGILLPPGGQVAAYVRSTGTQSGDDPALATNLVTTLAAGLARVRAGLGDTVFVLPGHSESGVGTTMMANLVAGTKIIGVGRGTNMPVFRWTATGDTWAISVNDVIIAGLRLRMEGANGITRAINITGTDCVLTGCDMQWASGAALKSAIAIEVGTGAVGGDRTVITGNKVRGTATHNVTNGILVSSTGDAIEITDNVITASATAANGLINLPAAATNLFIARNYLWNSMTSSTATIAVADVASTGLICDNESAVENNGVAANQGIVFAGTATTKLKCNQNFTSDEVGKDGALAPGVVAT